MLPEIITSVPGEKSRRCAQKLAQYEAREVTWLAEDFPIFWQRADGVNVWDADGNRFLDFTAAFAVTSLGHSAPAVRAALVEQAQDLLHAMGDVHPAVVKADLCEQLSRVTFERWNAGTGKTFLANSGSEAVEAALKTALLHSGKPGVISFTGAYHGLGHGALATSGLPYFREPFRDQLGRFGELVSYPACCRHPLECREGFRRAGGEMAECSSICLEEIEREISHLLQSREIGCILVEPVQGRGGEIVPPRDFLPLLRRLCDQHKVLLVLDEIYTGFHRTGRFFACEHSEVVPDIICLGKALTGGFPLAACVGRADIMDAWPESRGEALHTSTMLGNPLGCAMALASLRLHQTDEVHDQAVSIGRRLRAALEGLRSERIGQVRGLGSMLGVELVKPGGGPDGELAGAIMRRGLQDGLILLGGGPEGNVLSFSPPFGVTDEEIAFCAARIQEYLTSLPGSVS